MNMQYEMTSVNARSENAL